MRLSPTVVLRDDESPISFLARLALRNGIESAAHLCSVSGLDLLAVARAEERALRTLAELGGADPDILIANAVGADGGTAVFRGARVPRSKQSRDTVRVCPLCLVEDAANPPDPPQFSPYVRHYWTLPQFTACRVHRIALAEADGGKRRGAGADLAASLLSAWRNRENLAAAAAHFSPSPLEDYLWHRIFGGPFDRAVDPWLGALEWPVVAETSKWLGISAVIGRKAGSGLDGDEVRRETADAGFAILVGGPRAIEAHCERLLVAYRVEIKNAADPVGMFGVRFNRWLCDRADDPRFDPVRDLLAKWVFDAFPLDAGYEFAGKRLEARRFHSVRTASLKSGMHPARLRKVLFATGIAPKEQEHLPDYVVLMPAGPVEAAIGVSGTVDKLEVFAGLLGIDKKQARTVIAAGLIETLGGDRPGGAVRFAVRRPDVDGLIAVLFERATRTAALPPGAVLVVEATRSARCHVGAILKAILAGRVAQVWRVDGAVGVASLAIGAADVSSLASVVGDDATPFFEALKFLGTGREALAELLKHRIIESAQVVAPVRGGEVTAVSTRSLAEFEQTYVSLSALAKSRWAFPERLRRELAYAGVCEAWPAKKMRATWYRRDEVEAKMPK